MKLEEVLPHLRNGGKVSFPGGFHSTYSLIDVLRLNETILESDDFEIVKELHKSKGVRVPNIQNDGSYAIVINVPDPSKKYGYTIEEIE